MAKRSVKMGWKLIACDYEFWNVNCVYVAWNLPTSPVLSLSRFSSNVKTISAAETEISTASTARSWRKIAVILLLRHFWTLNFSSLKQWKGNNIYKLTQTWNSECSSYKYSMWQRTNVRTLRVCLQQRSSKVTWNYTWNLTLRRWITTKRNQQHGSKSSNYNPQVWPFEPAEESLCFMKGQLECQQRWKM